MSAQHIHNPALLATQPSDRFENWQISFTGPVLFQTLPSANPNALIRSDTPRERVDQRSLADACFSCNKDDLPFPSKHLFEPGLHQRQCFVAPHNSRSEIFGMAR